MFRKFGTKIKNFRHQQEHINNTKLISDLIEIIIIDTMQIYCIYDIPEHYIYRQGKLAFIDRRWGKS